MKDNSSVSTSWVQAYNISFSGVPLTVNLTNTITEKGITRTVNGIVYSDVIHVTSSLSIPGVPPAGLTSNINNYYARKYGMIENTTVINLNFGGVTNNTNQATILKSAVIKWLKLVWNKEFCHPAYLKQIHVIWPDMFADYN